MNVLNSPCGVAVHYSTGAVPQSHGRKSVVRGLLIIMTSDGCLNSPGECNTGEVGAVFR